MSPPPAALRGLSYYYKKDYDRAIPDFSEAIRLNPKWAVAFDSRGDAYVAKGDYERAIADFKQAILLDPSEAEKINPKLADAERKRSPRK